MKNAIIVLFCLGFSSFTTAQTSASDKNAALVYWSAIAQMKDFSLTEQEAQHLAAIVRGTAPYDENQFGKLVAENTPALETMIRGTAIPRCDWGIEEHLGPSTPIPYVRKARELGHLNLLYILHLGLVGDMKGAARALAAGLHFSHDIANGGTFLAALTASSMIRAHLAIVDWFSPKMNSGQKQEVRQALDLLGTDGIDWRANTANEMREIKIDLDQLAAAKDPNATYQDWFGHAPPAGFHGVTNEDFAPLQRLQHLWIAMMSQSGISPSTVEEARKSAPDVVQQSMPSPAKMYSAKTELVQAIAQTKSKL